MSGFDITRALDTCADLLERHGGHARAAGFTVRSERIDSLRARLMDLAQPALAGEKGEPRLVLDAQLSFAEIDGGLFQFVQQVEPCGSGNPEPLFASFNVGVVERRAVGSGREHLKLKLRQKGRTISAIAFRQGHLAEGLPERIDVAYRLQANDYWGTPEIELDVEALRPSENASR